MRLCGLPSVRENVKDVSTGPANALVKDVFGEIVLNGSWPSSHGDVRGDGVPGGAVRVDVLVTSLGLMACVLEVAGAVEVGMAGPKNRVPELTILSNSGLDAAPVFLGDSVSLLELFELFLEWPLECTGRTRFAGGDGESKSSCETGLDLTRLLII